MIDIENLPKIGDRSAEQIYELLGKPFRPEVIRSRRIAGKAVHYIPVSATIERLNKSCNSWSFRIVSHEMVAMKLNRWNDELKRSEPRAVDVFTAIGELTIPELGTRQGLGTQALDDGAGEDILKAAGSDALKRCAGLFGLWSPPVD